MEALLSYGFFQKALIAGIFIALACSLLGIFLVLKKDAMIGHGLAHVSFAGVALGLLINAMPMAVALGVAVLTALGIMKLKVRAGLYGDTAIAIFSSVGFALGILLATFAQKFSIDLFSYLFGEILAIERLEVWLSVGLAAVVLMMIVLNYSDFLYMTFDRESAKAAGVKVNQLDTMLTVLTAVTVVLGMKIVGILLVSALIVIPAASGLQVGSSFRRTLLWSCLIGVFSVVAGLVLSFLMDVPSSGMIVCVSFVLFGFCLVFKREKRLFRKK